jgi:choline-sulfatase
MSDTPDRPNVLLIVSDEHDPAVTGCYGDSVVETPHIDGLAEEGVTFEDCYTTSPLCSPARLSFTACQYVSRCGAWSNQSMLPADDYPSLPRAVSEAGYDAVLGGKMHYDASRRYGFRELWEMVRNQKHKDGTVERRDPGQESVNRGSWHERSSDFYPGSESFIQAFDREVTEHCSQFLRERAPDDEPFFLVAGYLAPHFPLVAPYDYYQKYQGEVPPPNDAPEVVDDLPENYRQMRKAFGVEGVEETEREKVQFGREMYWALVDWFDDQVGQLLGALEESAVAEETVVIYTSDHGEDKGDHGLWWKNCMYEHSAGVPLVVRWPERWAGGQRRSGACSWVDLARTVADLTGARVRADWDGDSLLPWLDDGDHDWKDLAVSEYYAHNTVTGFAMLRSGRYKYVYHAGVEGQPPEEELYDIEADPLETENLAGRPEHAERTDRMLAELTAELGEHPDDIDAVGVAVGGVAPSPAQTDSE